MGMKEFLLEQAEKEGFKIGIAKKNLTFTKNLLQLTDLGTAKIAELVGVSEDFVLKVKSDLNL